MDENCSSYTWAADVAVEIIVDRWNPSKVKYRREALCYSPKSCCLYVPGPVRRVPGWNGLIWIEEGWVNEEVTAHRGPDD